MNRELYVMNNKIFTNYIKNTLLLLSVIGLFVFATSPNPSHNVESIDNIHNTYLIDTAKSVLHWKAMVHRGTMKFNSGQITLSNNKVESADFHINMNSIKNTDVEHDLLRGTLENVLKSENLLRAASFPESHFELHTAEKLTDSTFHFLGDFIIFDNGICTHFDGNIIQKGDSLYFTTNLIPLDRTDWGIYYLSKNNLYPKEEEENMEVPDTIFVQTQIVAYKKLGNSSKKT